MNEEVKVWVTIVDAIIWLGVAGGKVSRNKRILMCTDKNV